MVSGLAYSYFEFGSHNHVVVERGVTRGRSHVTNFYAKAAHAHQIGAVDLKTPIHRPETVVENGCVVSVTQAGRSGRHAAW